MSTKFVAKITPENYQKLLLGIKNQILKSQENIIKNIARQKVVMAWEIGKMVDENLVKNPQAEYGKNLIENLSKDVFISGSTLYKMRNFYQKYPKLPKDDNHLNWTHYQKLSGIKEVDERKKLENLARENFWSSRNLQLEVSKSNSVKILENTIGKEDSINKTPKTLPKLSPIRGQLFSYPILTLAKTGKTYLDLGFNIFREAEEELPKLDKKSASVQVQKISSRKTNKYLLAKSSLPADKFNSYKAYLERVVDGDTILVTIDLGFKVLHKEIIRFKGIDALEKGTKVGDKSTTALTKILKDVPFLAIKTIKVDIYGRYVADVFFDENKNKNTDPQKVLDEGVYLNQILLDQGLAEAINRVSTHK